LIDKYFILGEESTNRSLPSVCGQKYPERRNLMSEASNVRIVRLDRMRVACYRAVSEHPENDAWKGLLAWARDKGLSIDENRRLFGFNNPNPSKGNPVYGYEVWMTVDGDIEATGSIKIKDFPGGLYAVAQTKLPQITSAWKQLVGWCKASEYGDACHQWLEESLTPPGTPFDDVVIDMYLPIEE
jgi:AraC family transcriptional regulator